MNTNLAVYLVILISVVISAIMGGVALANPQVRDFLGRHRVLVALTALPLLPIILVALYGAPTEEADVFDIKWVVLGALTYLNGLAAFAVVSGAQDAVLAIRARRRPPTR
ncbi:hypothetical protein [Acrocarpospora catenulata]|uniref:hypothetical protein n=1 Tax=Acrocarpospora catenulata TaxID=2836182 RepID=UPI001BDA6BBB|nr:hypothetical protein [Acrocarpospora catenulata]